MPPVAVAFIALTVITTFAACDMGGGGDTPVVWGETFDTGGMDTSVRAGDDFYRYANGRWLDTHPIPADAVARSSDTEVEDKVEEQIKGIITGAAHSSVAAATPAGSEAQKIGDLYNLFMDTARINREGAQPVRALLDTIDALDRGESNYRVKFSRLIAGFHRKGIAAFFVCDIRADALDSSRHSFTLGQGGYGPEQERYTSRPELIDGAYATLLEKFLELAGYQDYQNAARAALGIQKTLAASACTTEEWSHPDNIYHPVSRAELKAAVPALDWDAYLEVIGLPALTSVNLTTNENGYFSTVNSIVSGDLAGLKAYLAICVLQMAANRFLSADFSAAYNEYYKVFTGVETEPERWKVGVSLVNDLLPDAVGKLYVQQYFPGAYQKRVRAMVENIQSAFAQRIQNLAWMSASTKTEALAKLGAMRVRIGYLDTWRSYTTLTIDKNKSLFENILAVIDFYNQDAVATFYDPVDKDKWIMTPQTVNASYGWSDNSINLPAAFLQPPFFYPEGDDAINYGAIGATIGHEIIHGFDSDGRQYDYLGNRRDWWTSEDAAHFNTEADKLVSYFDTLQVDGQPVNGRMTLGENIADMGGLAIAYTAWRTTLAGGEGIDGFSGKQRFFLSYTRSWALNIRPEYQQQLLLSDPHAPQMLRVNGTLPHIGEWYEAFGVTEGAALYIAPEDRIGSIW
jgi:putative endopeptidase